MTHDGGVPAFARPAYVKALDTWDRLANDTLRREGAAMEARLREEGKSATEAAQAAQDHVNRLLIEMQRERARLEGEAAQRWQ